MAAVKVEKGKHFIKRGGKQKELFVIVQGRVNMLTKNDILPLDAGNIIGLVACENQEYQCDYVAAEDTVLMSYPYKKTEDMRSIFKAQPRYAHVFTVAAVKQASTILQHYKRLCLLAHKLYTFSVELYRDYRFLCAKYEVPERSLGGMEHLVPLDRTHILENWRIEYYRFFAKKDMAGVERFYGNDCEMNVGEIFAASETMRIAIEKMEAIWDYLHYWQDLLLDEGKNDLFQLYFDLEARAARVSTEISDMPEYVEKLMGFIRDSGLYPEEQIRERFAEYEKYDFTTISKEDLENPTLFEDENGGMVQEEYVEEQDCLECILSYASCTPEQIEQIRKSIISYRELPDIYSTEDNVRRLRKSLANMYYEIYKAAMKRALAEPQVPQILKMFFNFGFMDVELAGEDNANELYELVDRLSLCNSDHVYTMFEWLKSIYEGKKEPSRNEFDLDYMGYLADMRKSGRITEKEQKAWKDDQWKKVEFEIENMFTSSNRAVYGKISTFIPLLSENDIMNSVESMLVTANRIDELLNSIKSVDYSIFYRETTFSDPSHDITREFLKKEVLPDVILMPNAGCNAMMWQETAGSKRDTPARFLFPILTAANLDELMVETAGRFRWEICRKEQGARWNDIRELSLTSEYYDYVQYYRKNHELSPEAKEKMKNALWKAKNNYREVFIKDYQIWMKHESKGSFRMNKVARGILFRYCPFSKDMREALKTSPMYQELISKWNILEGRKKRHMEVFMDRYQKAGGEMTPELLENKEFYDL